MPSLVFRGSSSLVPCVLVFLAPASIAAEPDCGALDRLTLVACAEARSPSITAELASVRAAEGRREAGRPFLPANPMVSGSLASRTATAGRALNWSVTLAQELEIAGQSGLRVDAAEHELRAQQHQVAVARAEVAEQAWLAWFGALAARERLELTTKLERASTGVSTTVQAMWAQGLASNIDAAIADAAAVRASQARLEAERELASAEVQLGSLLGLSNPGPITGELEPLRFTEAANPARPELLALEAMQAGSSKRVELLRRGRAPNPTLSLFAQNDGFDERVFGVGLGIPIPLPQPIGRTAAGEIADALGREARQQAELERLSRALWAERELAAKAWATALKSRALYSSERLERARQGLAAITEQVTAARLSVREALIAQQALTELLQAEVTARHHLCVASVRRIRASGGSLEGGDL